MIYDGLHRHRSRHRRITYTVFQFQRRSRGTSAGRSGERRKRSSSQIYCENRTVSEPPARPPRGRLLGCPRVIEMGRTGKAGYYAREEGGRETGREMERHSWERWTTDGRRDGRGEKRADEKRRKGDATAVRGGIHGGSLHAAQRKAAAATAALCEGSKGRMEGRI